MKVLLAVQNFPPEFRGGTERVAAGLAGALGRRGAEVAVLAGSERPRAGGRLETCAVDGITVHRLHRPPEETYGVDLAWPRAGELVTEVLADWRPDVVHVHHWANLGPDLLQRAAALGIPGGATLHDLWTTCPRFFRRPPKGVRCPDEDGRGSCAACVRLDLPISEPEARAAIERRDRTVRRELELARFVAAPSKTSARLIARHLPFERARIEIVPHGLLEEPAARAEAPPPARRLRIGHFGNLVPEKGLDLLVEALEHLGSEVELVLAGHAPDPAYLERLRNRCAELGLPLRVLGPYGPGDPHPALSMDLAVFPSLCQESYGLVVEEALARGVPVVVSGRGALPERVERGGGIVVRAGGVMPLRVTLSRLVRSRRRIEGLRAEIPARFPTIADAAARYLELYETALHA